MMRPPRSPDLSGSLRVLAMAWVLGGGGAWFSAAESIADQPKDFVWRIPGRPGILFLAGSLHELRARDRPSQSLFDAYAQCDRIVFEAELAEFERPAFRGEINRRARLTRGETWTDSLDPATRLRLRKLARDCGLEEGEFERYRPWFAGNYSVLLLLEKAGFAEGHGTDRIFFDRAVREGKPREFLETGRQQLDQLSKLPVTEHLTALQHDLVDGLSNAEALVEAWQTGNLAAIEQMVESDAARTPQTVERLVRVRNLAWLPRLEGWLAQTNSTLVLVGAAHLAGTNGLVHLLENRGYVPLQLPASRRAPLTVPAP